MSGDPDPRPSVEIHAVGATWQDIVEYAEAEARQFFRGEGDVELVDSSCCSLTVNDAPTGMHEGLLIYRSTLRPAAPQALPTVIGDWAAAADREARIREVSPDAPDDLAVEGVEFHQYPDGGLRRVSGGATLPRAEWEERGWTFRPQTVEAPVDLLESLVDPDDCQLDHHGGCQAHGYLSLKPGEKCPQAQLVTLLAQAGCA